MEALLVINSILTGVSLYFAKDFRRVIREAAKNVEQPDDKVRIMSDRTDSQKSNLSQPGSRRH